MSKFRTDRDKFNLEKKKSPLVAREELNDISDDIDNIEQKVDELDKKVSSQRGVGFGQVREDDLEPRLRQVLGVSPGAPASSSTTTPNASTGGTHTHDIIDIPPESRLVSAGVGLTGGGSLAADRTISMGTPSSCSTTTANSATGTTHTHDIVSVPPDTRAISAGVGLSGGGNLTADRTISMGTPSTCTQATANGASGTTHQHAITGFMWKTAYITSTNYTITDTDGYGMIYPNAGVTITLPTVADNVGREICILNAGGNTVTVEGEGSEPVGFSGALNFRLYAQGDYVILRATASQWAVIGTNGPIVRWSTTSDVAISSPAVNTWYNPTSHQISLDAGIWELSARVMTYAYAEPTSSAGGRSVAVHACLSTANNSATDNEMVVSHITRFYASTGATYAALHLCQVPMKRLILSASDIYYLNIAGYATSGTLSLETLPSGGSIDATTVIEARRVG